MVPAYKCSSRLPGCLQSGFTLAEVMIALALLVLGVMSAVMFIGSVERSAAFTEHVTAGMELGQAKIEDLLLSKWSDMTDGSDATSIYSRTWTLSGEPDTKTIEVAVAWNDFGGYSRTVTVQAVRCR